MKEVNFCRISRNTGLSVSYVSRVMRGVRKNPSIVSMELIARDLGITIDYLRKKIKEGKIEGDMEKGNRKRRWEK
jgi:transcriptional regulator with XRE-family HTH domain